MRITVEATRASGRETSEGLDLTELIDTRQVVE